MKTTLLLLFFMFFFTGCNLVDRSYPTGMLTILVSLIFLVVLERYEQMARDYQKRMDNDLYEHNN